MWQWKTKSPISRNGISKTTGTGLHAPLVYAAVEPSQLSVLAARGSGTLSCSTNPSSSLVGIVVPVIVSPASTRKRVWWMWKLWSSLVRFRSSQTSLTAEPFDPKGTQIVVLVGSKTWTGLRVVSISRPLSSTST